MGKTMAGGEAPAGVESRRVQIRRRSIPLLHETVHQAVLEPGGLPAVLVPKPGLTRKTAILAARYGSLDIEFGAGGRSVTTPPGVAHFLEHQLFKKHGGDALMEFSRYGATSNAFTDYSMTAYYFVCSENFEPALEELFRLVLRPEFAPDRVEKEKAIIKQELLMYLDMPDHRAYQNLVESMYASHPVRIDIGGTVESIQRVTPETLDLCYGAFYQPSNLLLVMSGDLASQKTFQAAQKLLRRLRRKGARPPAPIERRLTPEAPSVRRAHASEKLVVSRPRVLLGIKDGVRAGETPEETARRDLEVSILLDHAFGRSSDYFSREYETGLINDDFSAAYMGSETFGFSVIEAETENPDAFLDSVGRELAAAARRPVPRADLERLQRKISGRFIRAFDSPENSAFVLLETLHRRVELQRLIDLVFEIRPADLARRAADLARPERRSVSVVLPKERGA